jgi:predicted metal-dependent phosphoesterase TrpH
MLSSTTNLVLSPGAAIDLQTHTVLSDGAWTPDALMDYAVNAHFGLIAITDHDRADTVPQIQALALEKGLPVLAAVEMSASWKGEMTDILCFGFDPQKSALAELAQDVIRRQRENTREVLENLCQKGYTFPNQQPGELDALLQAPSAQQPHELVALLKKHGYEPVGKLLHDAGVTFATNSVPAIVDAAHRSAAICILAHPGRSDGFVCYDAALLDELRAEAPLDGIEVYYPMHSPGQIALYEDYTHKHDLLTSSGSDSHGANRPPIPYPAHRSRRLLERVGIHIK